MNKLSHLNIKRVFTESFSARDLAESLISFDHDSDAADIRARMAEYGGEVAGLRRQGTVVGYVRREELGRGPGAAYIHLFEEADILPDSASFARVIKALGDRPFVFISVFGGVGGLIRREDLQKPAMRMWLFGMITIMEMEFVRMIQNRYGDEGWQGLLSAGRLRKALQLFKERRRLNQRVSLLDCLQLSDKGRILVKEPASWQKLGFASSGAAKEAFKQIESLRNNLAHSQEIGGNRQIILSLCAGLDAMFKP